MSENPQNSIGEDSSAPNASSTEVSAENGGEKSKNSQENNDGKSENSGAELKKTELELRHVEEKSGNDDGKSDDNNGNSEDSGKMPQNNENSENDYGGLENNVEKPNQRCGGYPLAIFFILGNEFCERFSYYGLRTILTLFIKNELGFNEKVATMIFHSFVLLNYLTPFFGAIIADSWLGKYHTILYISIIYAIGNITLSIGSIPMEKTKMIGLSMFGLMIIGMGTGGIKPCVSAFGGDQFEVDQVKERQRFFHIFFFVINFGSFISTILSPILREDVHCLGQNTCYVLAFSVPAMLMAVAVIVFVLGKPLYKMIPVQGSAFPEIFKCIGHALSKKLKSRGERKDHWLDYAEDKYDKKQIQDVKTLLSVLLLFLPLPVFWCLFEQMSSTWVLQATKMDGDVNGFFIKPDQMQAWNPLFILIFIPFFDFIVYPLFAKCNLLQRPLQRMAAGMLLAALSFVIVGLIELNLEDVEPVLPGKGYSEVKFINNSPCKIKMTGFESKTLDAFDRTQVVNLELGHVSDWNFEPSDCDVNTGFNKTINASTPIETVMVTVSNKELQAMQTNDSRKKIESGKPRIRIVFSIDFAFLNNKSAIELHGPYKLEIVPDRLLKDSKAGMTEYYTTYPGKYKIYLPNNTSDVPNIPIGEYDFKSGATYIVIIYQDLSKNVTKFSVEETVKRNSVSILYQAPANIIATAGEICFSITGVEFAYSQSPTHLKAVVQSAWQMTNAFGNLLYVIITKISIVEKQSVEFFMYAGLMVADTLVFAILCYFYKYVEIPNS